MPPWEPKEEVHPMYMPPYPMYTHGTHPAVHPVVYPPCRTPVVYPPPWHPWYTRLPGTRGIPGSHAPRGIPGSQAPCGIPGSQAPMVYPFHCWSWITPVSLLVVNNTRFTVGGGKRELYPGGGRGRYTRVVGREVHQGGGKREVYPGWLRRRIPVIGLPVTLWPYYPACSHPFLPGTPCWAGSPRWSTVHCCAAGVKEALGSEKERNRGWGGFPRLKVLKVWQSVCTARADALLSRTRTDRRSDRHRVILGKTPMVTGMCAGWWLFSPRFVAGTVCTSELHSWHFCQKGWYS